MISHVRVWVLRQNFSRSSWELNSCQVAQLPLRKSYVILILWVHSAIIFQIQTGSWTAAAEPDSDIRGQLEFVQRAGTRLNFFIL